MGFGGDSNKINSNTMLFIVVGDSDGVRMGFGGNLNKIIGNAEVNESGGGGYSLQKDLVLSLVMLSMY